jgi:RNA polymerase sigma-70 factor (ECF subfamily)
MSSPAIDPCFPATPDPQAELLALCQRNPEAGFARLHAQYLPLVWALCLRVLGSRAWAEDACQECFIRIWKGLETFRGESRLSTWIWTVSHRCVTSLALREARGERRAGQRVDSDDLAEVLPDSAPGTDRELENRDLLQRLLAELNPSQRSAITLFYMQELSVAEVSAITGQSEGAVRVILHRARQRMAGVAHYLEQS